MNDDIKMILKVTRGSNERSDEIKSKNGRHNGCVFPGKSFPCEGPSFFSHQCVKDTGSNEEIGEEVYQNRLTLLHGP